jgi:hypothetical protein
MSNKRISDLPVASTPTGPELFECLQGGVNKQVALSLMNSSVEVSSGILDVNTTQVGTVGTGEDVLYTYTVEADTLAADGDTIRGRISGIVGNNGNVKSIKLKFGATTFMTRGTTTPTIGQGFTIDFEITRTGATSQKCNATFSGSDGTASSYYSVAGETLSGDVDIELTGEGTDNDDVIKHSVTLITLQGGIGGAALSSSYFATRETPSGAVNDVNVTYTLANIPSAFVHVYIDGLLMDEGGGNDYTISGATITMTSAPLTGSKIRVSYIK